MEIGKLQGRQRSVVVEVGPDDDDRVRVVYRPGVLTPAELDTVDSAEPGERLAAVAALLAKTVVSWDLTDDGEMYPLTAEALGRLDLQFLNLLQTEVISDARPKSGRKG